MSNKKIRFIRYASSDSLNDLVAGLKEKGHNVLKQKLRGSTWQGCASHYIINWGLSHRGTVREGLPILNEPTSVFVCSSKTKTLQKLRDEGMYAHIPKFVTNITDASSMLQREGVPIYCRTLDNSSQGNGIKIAREINELVAAPLYTQMLPSIERELRIHVFKSKVIDFQQKKRIGRSRREAEGIQLDEEIRNLNNGWIFARDGVTIDDTISSVAVKAVNCVGLDFGAVDLVISDGIPKVLEINSAPGLSGTTLLNYADAIHKYVEGETI
jgi:hypothetical protein